MPALQATVKSVLSGDTVTLVNAKGAERSLSLAYVSAPRLKRDGDEVNYSSARRARSEETDSV
jgi:staphylococcal nuclease domain-containing protein 1